MSSRGEVQLVPRVVTVYKHRMRSTKEAVGQVQRPSLARTSLKQALPIRVAIRRGGVGEKFVFFLKELDSSKRNGLSSAVASRADRARNSILQFSNFLSLFLSSIVCFFQSCLICIERGRWRTVGISRIIEGILLSSRD